MKTPYSSVVQIYFISRIIYIFTINKYHLSSLKANAQVRKVDSFSSSCIEGFIESYSRFFDGADFRSNCGYLLK